MATREQLRAQTIPDVARLARSRDFRSTFAEVAVEPRQQTIISTLPDDTMGYVLDRLQEAGGTAILVLLVDQVFHIAALLPASDARIAVAEEDGVITEVHEDTQVDTFFHYLANTGGTAVIKRVTAKLINHGTLQLT